MSKKMDYIVGIGASAGGLEAMQRLFMSLPSNTGFPYIVVQHLSPDYKSLLSEILGKYTEMSVIQVEEGMEIKPDCVYVIQPGKNIQISDGKIVLTSQKEKELNLPIDLFFKSLAEDAGERAIAIVLSGTGSDGTNGIKSIKENEGMILVQNTETAKFDGMPKSAIRTGLVDAQLSPEEMAVELMHISTSYNSGLKFKTEKQIDDELMKKIYFILKKWSGINFTHYKQTTILRRIERRMMLTHKETLAEYVEHLYADSEEVKTLSKEVLIGVTNFFRDPEYFQSLAEKAITDIVLRCSPEEIIRVWVAGCSTGEEAYSIAILFSEITEKLGVTRNVKIFATDLDVESIAFAGKGAYGDSIVNAVSSTRLSKFFTRQNNTFTVNRDIRKMIVFSPHNVFQDPPFGRLDLISCRNLLIYFQPVLQNDLFAIFHSSLKDEGYLFLGKSEAIGAFTEAFPVVDPVAKIFSHKSKVKIPGSKPVPYLQNMYEEDFSSELNVSFPQRNLSSNLSEQGDEAIDIRLMEEFMPACLIINRKNEVVHTFGDNTNYVHLSLGKFSNIVYDLIADSLKVPVSTILKESRDGNTKVQYKGINFEGERSNAVINLTALPINRNGETSPFLHAIIFSNENERVVVDNAIPYNIDRVAAQRITDLEQNLNEVQGKLNRSVAEQECINEELQAANEELLTANEELQSSNEELQSVNEELYTVNSEYQQKLTELADLNDDIANFLSSTLIGIIFVDNKLNIRRYTDYVTKEFSVMDHDIGRSLKFISYHFPTIDISEICDSVLKTLIPEEREITTSKKRVFFMRVAPYRSTENKILGCVITLVDVTTQKQGLLKLQDTEEMLSMVRQENEEKTDYFSRIIHEIRTPIGVLSGIVKEARNHSRSEKTSNDFNRIERIIDYVSSLVTDISGSSKNEGIEIAGVREFFDLRDVISDVSSIISQKASESSIDFKIVLDEDFNPSYVGNKTAVQQVLINILNNSIKYTPSGGSVSLKSFETGVNNEPNLVFIITDNGIGISKEFIPKLFIPFTRENEKDENSLDSMGLGLSITYNLVKAMNGDIEVTSEKGKGTTFTVTLRLPKQLVEEENKGKKSFDLSKCNLMIAEDNQINRTILVSVLKHYGISCIAVCDGEEAVNKFNSSEEFSIDCILMDMRMPKIDGIKATEMIRKSSRKDANVPIIAVSANSFSNDIKQAKIAGIDGYLYKPIDRDKLIELITEVIGKSHIK